MALAVSVSDKRARGFKVFHGYISEYVRGLDPLKVYGALPLHRKILFRLTGRVLVEKVYVETPIGTWGVSEVYLVRCPYCGEVFVDYVHGYSRYVVCPRCMKRTYL